jgi:hypothetical protein
MTLRKNQTHSDKNECLVGVNLESSIKYWGKKGIVKPKFDTFGGFYSKVKC